MIEAVLDGLKRGTLNLDFSRIRKNFILNYNEIKFNCTFHIMQCVYI